MSQRRDFRRWFAATALVLTLLLSSTKLAGATPSVAEPFRDYYNKHQGLRTLGYPLTDLMQVDGYPAQYFEKGRLEDHRRDATDPKWAYMYGRLPSELSGCDPYGDVDGTSYRFTIMQTASEPKRRHPI